MARSPSAPLLQLLPVGALVALALVAALQPAPGAEARFLQVSSADARPWGTHYAPAHASDLRQRRSPKEEMQKQEEDTEPVDPEQKPAEKPGFFKRAWNAVKKAAKKVVEVVSEILEMFGCDTKKMGSGGSRAGSGSGGDGGGGEDNAETMAPDRLQSESESQQ